MADGTEIVDSTKTIETVRTMTLYGRDLRVSVRPGDASRTPLLLCNGIGASLDVLQPFVDALDPALEVIRFDMPGVGGSPRPVVPYHMSTFAPVLAELVKQLGHEQVDVLGISWGGGLAQQFAVQCRRRCRRVVLVATATGSLMVPAKLNVLSKMATPRRHRDPAYARRIAGEIYGGSARTDPGHTTRLLHDGSPKTGRRGYFYQLAAGLGWSSLPCLGLLRQRTLILAGDDDPIIPEINARMMHRLIPRATLHVYAGGHLALVSEADQLAPIVDAFLAGD